MSIVKIHKVIFNRWSRTFFHSKPFEKKRDELREKGEDLLGFLRFLKKLSSEAKKEYKLCYNLETGGGKNGSLIKSCAK